MNKPLIITSKYFPEYCGPAVRIKNLYDSKPHLKTVNIITGSSDYTYSKKYDFEKYFVRRISLKWWKSIDSDILRSAIKPVFQCLETIYTFLILSYSYRRIDVVHILGSSPVTHAGLLWCIIFNKKLVIELVNRNALPYQKLFGIFKLYPRKKNSIIITISDELEMLCIDHGYDGIVWNRPNPVNLNRFTPTFKDNNYTERVRLLNIGSFIPRKNQLLLLEMMKYLPSKYQLELAGPLTHKDKSEAYYQRLVEYIKENNLSERVTMNVGYVDSNVRMRESDIYLLPSYGEGLGTTLLEAISLNLPVVANNEEPAFLQWVTNGKNGYAAKPTAEAFSERVLAINEIDNNSLRKHNERTKKMFCSTEIHSKYKKIFEQLSSDEITTDIVSDINKDI